MAYPRFTTEPEVLRQCGWEAFVTGHPAGSVFQSPSMFDFYQAVNHFEPLVVGHLDGNGRVDGILLAVIIREISGPLGFFSSRCVIYGGPVISAGGPVAGSLVSVLVEMVQRRTVFIQFRNLCDMSAYRDQFGTLGFRYRPRLNSIIDTASEEVVMGHISSGRIRQVRQGFSRGAEIIEASTLEEIREFYDILKELYRKKVRKPLPEWTFFKEFFFHSRATNTGIILLVRYRGRIIGGILCPYLPGKSIFEWYVCGLDRDFKEVHPSVLATWAGIRFAFSNGLSHFDFLGIGLPGKPYGVRDFKSRFGGDTVDFGRYSRINNRLLYFLAETGYNFLAILKKI